MKLRRALYRWMWIAALALPGWTLLGWMLFSRGGWALAGVLVALPLLFVALLGVASVTALRPGMRPERALPVGDAAVLLLWHLSIVVFGTFQFEAAWTVTAMILIGLLAFWRAVWLLVAAVRKRAADISAEYQQMRTPNTQVKQAPDWQGEMIVIDESKPPQP